MHAAGLQDGSRRPLVFRRTKDGLGHSDTSFTGIYLDIDAPPAASRISEAVNDGRIADPNIVIVRRRSGHAAAGWFLSASIHKYPGARDAPQQLFRRTTEYYRHVLGGDPGYNGATFRNAMVADFHPDEWIVERPAEGAYPLGRGLSDFIPRGWRIPRIRSSPPVVVVLNGVQPRGRDADEAAEAIRNLGVDVAPPRVVNRVLFARALITGHAAGEVRPQGKAAREIERVHEFMCAQLNVGG